MRKDLGAKEWLYPMPALVVATWDEGGVPDAMVAAWGGISDNKEIALCLDASHKTVANILRRRAFTVSPATKEHIKECDYLGLVSANNTPDKFAASGLHALQAPHVDAPLIEQLPLTLECELLSYDEASSHLFARIVNVSADECILTQEGKVNVTAFAPVVFDPANHTYLEVAGSVAKAFSAGLVFKKL